MSFKTKLLSLFLLGLLLLPTFLGPRSTGTVLGVFENNANQAIIESETTTNSQIGEIASGAFETKAVDNTSTRGKVYQGKAIWDENSKSQVITDKFSLGKSIKINSKDKSLDLIVGDVRVLGEDTLVVLNRDTFILLGGNPDTQNNIDVSVIAD
jgi:hypothetical protein